MPPFFLFHKREKSDFTWLQKTEVLLLNILSKQLQSFPSHNDHLHSIVNFYKPFHLHPRNIVLPYIADTFKKLPKVTLKKSSLSKCAYWSNFRSIIFFSSKKFATNQHEEKKKSQRQPKCLQHFWRGVQLHFSFFSKEEVFFTMEWRVKPTKWRMAGTFRKTSLL